MDPISTALTAAWLDAVRRVQSDRVQRLEGDHAGRKARA